jgi:hypothetical protein
MSVNGINNVTQTYDTTGTTKTKTSQAKSSDETKRKDTETAAVYEKSESDTSTSAKKIYKRDQHTIDRLLAEAEKRSQSLRDLVQKMFTKQGETFTEATDIYALLREGKVQVDPETKAQAQKDIAEDGYWGVNQTSDRMVSFAKALAGSDPSKADELIEAVKKGFEEATKSWGDELPDISKRTLEATIKKMEAWRDGTEDSSSMTDAAAKAFTNQTATSALS